MPIHSILDVFSSLEVVDNFYFGFVLSIKEFYLYSSFLFLFYLDNLLSEQALVSEYCDISFFFFVLGFIFLGIFLRLFILVVTPSDFIFMNYSICIFLRDFLCSYFIPFICCCMFIYIFFLNLGCGLSFLVSLLFFHFLSFLVALILYIYIFWYYCAGFVTANFFGTVWNVYWWLDRVFCVCPCMYQVMSGVQNIGGALFFYLRGVHIPRGQNYRKFWPPLPHCGQTWSFGQPPIKPRGHSRTPPPILRNF